MKQKNCRVGLPRGKKEEKDQTANHSTVPQRLIESGSRQLFKGQVISEEFFLVFSFVRKKNKKTFPISALASKEWLNQKIIVKARTEVVKTFSLVLLVELKTRKNIF